MRLTRISWWMVVLVALLMGQLAWATQFRPATLEEQAHYGATHVESITYADLSGTASNTAETVSNITVSAGEALELVAMVLDTAFDAGAGTTTVTVAVGDGTDADLFMSATQIASDGTEVFVQLGRQSIEAITTTTAVWTNGTALVATTTTYTNATWDSGASTGNISTVTYALTTQVQTNLTAATLAQSELGRKYYSSDDKVDILFTPTGTDALGDMTSGEIRFLFRKIRRE